MLGKITKRTVDGTKSGRRDAFVWDTQVKGFGLKVTPRGKKVYVLQYRLAGRQTPKRFTIGSHGSPWTPDQARAEAISLLGRVKEGFDPARERQDAKNELTLSELCDQYLEEGCSTKKPSTIATDTGRVERHIKPILGRMLVKDVTPNDVRRFMNAIARGKTAADVRTKPRGRARVTGGKGTATRTVGLLGGIFSFAIAEGLRSDNPVAGVRRFPDNTGQRFLTAKELARLGKVLAAEQAENPLAVAATRLLIFTGCRKTEILSLRWSSVDFDHGCLRLRDSKSGEKVVMLGAPALEILAGIPRIDDGPYVLPATRGGGHFVGLPKAWVRIRNKAKLVDVRLHDLRHSFVSVGVSAGLGLPIIGKLVGHSDPRTTQQYAHIADDPARSAAEKISGSIAAQLDGQNPGSADVVPIKSDTR